MTTHRREKTTERLSKLIGLDLRYFIYNGSWVYLSYSVSILTGLILSYFYANYLNKTIFGEFNFVLSVFSLVGIFSLPGMGQALTLALIKGFQQNFNKAIKYTIYFASAGTALILLVALIYHLKAQSGLSSGLVVLAILFPAVSISTYYQSKLSATRKFKTLALINTVNFILTCLAVVLVILTYPSLPFLIIASLGTPLVVNLFFTYQEIQTGGAGKVDKSYLNLGLHLSLTSSISFLSKSLDKIIIGLLLPIEYLALYSFALLIPDQVFAFVRQVVPLLIPKIAELKDSGYKKPILKNFLISEMLMVIIIVGYFLLSPFVFSHFFPKYLGDLFLTQLYSLSILSLPTFLFGLLFQKLKLNKFIYIQEISFTSSLVLLLLITVPHWGITGAILSQVIARSIYLLVSIALLKLA